MACWSHHPLYRRHGRSLHDRLLTWCRLKAVIGFDATHVLVPCGPGGVGCRRSAVGRSPVDASCSLFVESMMEVKRNAVLHLQCFGKNDVQQKLIGVTIGSAQSGMYAAQARETS